jgi:hypothetical protein
MQLIEGKSSAAVLFLLVHLERKKRQHQIAHTTQVSASDCRRNGRIFDNVENSVPRLFATLQEEIGVFYQAWRSQMT